MVIAENSDYLWAFIYMKRTEKVQEKLGGWADNGLVVYLVLSDSHKDVYIYQNCWTEKLKSVHFTVLIIFVLIKHTNA